MNLHRNNTTPDSGAQPCDRPSPATADGDPLRQRLDALVHALCPDAPAVETDCPRRIAALLEDAAWECDPVTRRELAAVMTRIHGTDDPGAPLPPDLSWPRLSREIQAHGDFLRLREMEASLRHAPVGGFPFDRHDWEHARDQESALREHQCHVREASYAPAPTEVFRVH